MVDYYSILELKPLEATPIKIKKQYHALSLKTHPDKHPELDPEIFRTIKEAYDVLSDPVSKREYDLRVSFASSSSSSSSSSPTQSPSPSPSPSPVVPPPKPRIHPVKVNLTLFKTQLGTNVNITFKAYVNKRIQFNTYLLFIPQTCVEKNMICVQNIGHQVGEERGEVHFLIQKIIDQYVLERELEKQRVQFEQILQSRRLATLPNKKVSTHSNYLMNKKANIRMSAMNNIRMNSMNQKFSRYSFYQSLV